MTSASSQFYAVGLVADDGKSPTRPTFRQSALDLKAALGDRGKMIGFIDDPHLGYAHVEVTDPSIIEELRAKDFVERLPVPGVHKDIFPASQIQIQRTDASESYGGTDVEEDKPGVQFG